MPGGFKRVAVVLTEKDMDIDAGMPILGACVASILLFLWVSWQHHWISSCIRLYTRRRAHDASNSRATALLKRTFVQVRRVMIASMLAAPLVMLFSGQLDSHGLAHLYNDRLQIIAPLTSACISAAVLWLLIASPIAVYLSHRRMLDLFDRTEQRGEFW